MRGIISKLYRRQPKFEEMWRVLITSVPPKDERMWARLLHLGPREAVVKAIVRTSPLDDFEARFVLQEMPRDLRFFATEEAAQVTARAMREAGATCEALSPDAPEALRPPKPWGLYISGIPEDPGGLCDRLRGAGPRGRAIQAIRMTVRPPGTDGEGLDAFELRWFLGKLPVEVDLFDTQQEALDAAAGLRDAGVPCEVRDTSKPSEHPG
jgi:hypothetical protein